jgi:ATP-dependent RNA helicase DDX5/DBP2
MGGLGTGLKNINWDTANLPKFGKDFYVEDKRVSVRSDREVDDFRRKHEMKVKILFISRLCR